MANSRKPHPACPSLAQGPPSHLGFYTCKVGMKKPVMNSEHSCEDKSSEEMCARHSWKANRHRDHLMLSFSPIGSLCAISWPCRSWLPDVPTQPCSHVLA